MSEKTTTSVHEEDINLDELLGTPGAENVLVPEKEKPTVFSRKENLGSEFLDNIDEKEEEEEVLPTKDEQGNIIPAPIKASTVEEIDALLKPVGDTDTESASKKAGRHNGLIELTKKLIEKGQIVPFDGEEDIEKYTLKDFEDLFEANNVRSEESKGKIKEEVSADFFDSLPEELQVAAHYVANGGTDLKSLFKSLAASEEIKSLDVEDEDSQEQIVRSYLHATKFGTPEEIELEIEEYKDGDKLGNKARQFKPKLDSMQEQIVARQLEQQERLRVQQQKQAQEYTNNIYKVLEAGELNGIKLDKKIQNELFGGLTQANYPSMSGRPTNLLGHLLEKYQYQEPNHALLSEGLWLLKDPEGYKNKLRDGGKKETVLKTVRTLKTEESSKNTSSTQEDETESRVKKVQGVQRPTGSNFFKR